MARVSKGTSQGVTRRAYKTAWDLRNSGSSSTPVPQIKGTLPLAKSRVKDYTKTSKTSFPEGPTKADYDRPQVTNLDDMFERDRKLRKK